MGKANTLTTRKVSSLVTALLLVVAILTSLFAVTVGNAEESTTKDPNQYTVSFDANGGYFDEKDEKGNNLKVVKRTGYKGQGLDDKSELIPHYPADSTGKEGKVFEGWSATNDNKINVETRNYDPEKDITVKAVWSDRITVTFDYQDGKTTVPYYFDKGESIDMKTIPQPTPKDGKVFSGWYEDSACTKEAMNYGVLKPTQSVTYYAGYSEGATITLIGNGGHYLINKGNNKDAQNEEYRTTLTKYLPKGTEITSDVMDSFLPVRSYPGKYFGGYYTNKDFAEDSKVNIGDIIKSDMTLYAKWVDRPEYDEYLIVTYKVYDESEKRWANYAEFDIDVGEALTKDIYLDAPEKANLSFIGWYTNPELTEAAPKFDGSYVPKDDITLYAKYNDVVTINLTYWYANNNSENVRVDTEPVEATYVKDTTGERADIGKQFTNRFLSDDELLGLGLNPQTEGISTTWYADKAHTKVVKGKADLTIDKDGNANIYGVLVKRQTVTLNTDAKIGGQIFKGDELISAEPAKDAKYVTADAYINNDMTLADAAKYYSVKNIDDKKMKAFAGWSEKDGSTTPVGDKVAKGVENLYAIIGNAYKVTIDLNGGYDRASSDIEAPRKNIITVNVADGNKVDEVLNSINPHYYGDKVFKEWTLDKEGKQKLDPETYVVKGAVTIYAQWTRYTPEEEKLNGLVKGPDGKWAVYKDNVVQKDYNGLCKNKNGWYFIRNGYVDWNYTGFGQNLETKKWYRVKDGRVDFTAQSIYKKPENGVWYKTTNGRVTFEETGVFKNENGWWRVENSRVNFKADGIYKNENGWWKTTGGKVHFNENGVFKNENGWWKVENSKVNFNFKGIASNKNGTWYLEGGKVQFNKNGKVKYNGKTYIVTNGKAKLA